LHRPPPPNVEQFDTTAGRCDDVARAQAAVHERRRKPVNQSQSASDLSPDVGDDLLPLLRGLVGARSEHAGALRPFAKAIEVEPVHELGHHDGDAIDHVGVQHPSNACVAQSRGSLGNANGWVVQAESAAAPRTVALDSKDAIEPGKTANASPIGFDPAIDTKAFLKLVPAKLAGPGLIANHRERGCICHQCYYRSVDATL